jgi:putative tryptophan/tyrosine transport system substrate-binding protein
MNRRRAVLALAALAPWAAIPIARSQGPGKPQVPGKLPRVAVLTSGSAPNARSRLDAFRKGMEELGYIEGRNVRYEFRSANGQLDLLREDARALASSVDVIVSASSYTTRALQDASVSVPVVMVAVEDPVVEGFARSLAHPGGNYTGLSAGVVDHAPRFIELLSQASPRLARLALLANPSNPTYRAFRTRMESAAFRAGAKAIVVLEASTPEQLETAFPFTGEDVPDGVVVMYDTMLYSQRLRIVELARDTRRPFIYPQRAFVEAGGLMSYGPQPEQNYRRAASYVDRILKGALPRDMAIEPVPHFELVINRAAARGLGVQLPAEFLKKADRIIG